MEIMTIEILRIGPDNALYQLCDGKNFGVLAFDDDATAPLPFHRRAAIERPAVLAFVAQWLMREGVLLGSPNPPRMRWTDIAEHVPCARLPSSVMAAGANAPEV
ncbi:hypothetical protein AAFN86_25695 [Roseomonas sp. CAU 1739]|uniref:hypothetical protein n=1 Tax=Roseomonas sp. CAU 1739 TaxID=3140364 RepID=UPI00325BF1F6